MKAFISSLAAGAMLALSATSVMADREPNAAERSSIEAALREQGYKSWGEIELDDGRWEVDDARAADGVSYDLELEQGSLRIVKREKDD